MPVSSAFRPFARVALGPPQTQPQGDLWGEEQNRMIANWVTILRNWDTTLHVPSYVRIVLENLRMASDPNSSHNPPVTHFLRFLGYEDAALKWFLYETIAVEWLWGNKRMDYIQGILPRVDLDSHFPVFPGSPGTQKTVRQFLLSHLSASELREIPSVLPPLPATPPPSPSPPAPMPLNRVMFRLLRKPPQQSAKKDDIITIQSSGPSSYTITYQDKSSKCMARKISMSRTQVFEYLSLVFRMVKEDDDPFDSLQIIYPAMPTILFSVSRLDSETRNLIYDGLAMTFDSWVC